MCLTVKIPWYLKLFDLDVIIKPDFFNKYIVKTAAKDITVCKVLDGNSRTGLVTPFRQMPMTLGKTYHTEKFGVMMEGYRNRSIEIHEGFHSYITPSDSCDSTCQLYHAVIPKGTKYVLGHGQVVSLSLKIVDKFPCTCRRCIRERMLDNASQVGKKVVT
jgi:hypothetical protein